MAKETRNLITFVAATFIWTWAFYAPIAFSEHPAIEKPQAI